MHCDVPTAVALSLCHTLSSPHNCAATASLHIIVQPPTLLLMSPGVMDMLERMKEEVAEAQRVADKHKAAASHIKEQLREVSASARHTEGAQLCGVWC